MTKNMKTKLWNFHYSGKLEGKCIYCSTTITPWTVEFDHIRPVARGKATTLENLQPVCMKCNRKKGAKLNYKPNIKSHTLKVY